MAVTKKTSTKKVVAKKKVAPARKVTKPALKKVKAGGLFSKSQEQGAAPIKRVRVKSQSQAQAPAAKSARPKLWGRRSSQVKK